MIDWLLAGARWGEGDLVWTTDPRIVAGAAVVAVVAWGVALLGGWRSVRSRPLRMVESALWAVALTVVVLGIAGPELVEEDGREELGKLVVLVDGSGSMGVADGASVRSTGAVEALETLRASQGPVDVYTFDETVRAGAPEQFRGRGTDLGAALDVIADRHLGQTLRGVVVLSDGLDRGPLRREVVAATEQGTLSASVVPTLPGPVTFVQTGESTSLFDLSVEHVTSGGFAFLRTPFVLRAEVRGPAGRAVPVTLSREGRTVREQSVTLDSEGRAEVEFTVVPRQVGRFAWEVAVPVEAGDAVPGNNTFPVVVRVVRERTRVLQVSGSPSYDQKFLRLFLKEDPSVDLVSFFILRTREDFRSGWQQHEMSLIEFPYQRLFTEDLSTFDLVILQNFNYRPYFSHGRDDLLLNIAEYVRQGGALVMTGGDRSFDLGEYARTPISEVLPIELGVSGVKTDESPFRPELTAAGAVHPLTRLGATTDESRAIWDRLPTMDGANLNLGLAPGAAALLVHPGLQANSEPLPILSVREVAEGRTMALAVDASWRWSFSEAAEGRGNQAYLRFWKNALRWLVADPDDRRVVVVPSRENVLLGDEMRLTVRVRDAGYGPVEGAEVVGNIEGPDGSRTPIALTTDASGEGVFAYRPEVRGAHRVSVGTGNRSADRGSTVFAVSNRDPELADIQPDEGFLRQLASLYGDRGRFLGPGDDLDILTDDAARRTVPDRRVVSLGGAPIVGLLFGLLGGVAWMIRRRNGGV